MLHHEAENNIVKCARMQGFEEARAVFLSIIRDVERSRCCEGNILSAEIRRRIENVKQGGQQ